MGDRSGCSADHAPPASRRWCSGTGAHRMDRDRPRASRHPAAGLLPALAVTCQRRECALGLPGKLAGSGRPPGGSPAPGGFEVDRSRAAAPPARTWNGIVTPARCWRSASARYRMRRPSSEVHTDPAGADDNRPLPRHPLPMKRSRTRAWRRCTKVKFAYGRN